MKNLLLSPDPAQGPGSSSETPAVVSNPPTAAPVNTPPPAAAAVLSGSITEDSAQLRDELENERKLRKQREMEINELQDNLRSLKNIPAPAQKAKPSPWTFFEGED